MRYINPIEVYINPIEVIECVQGGTLKGANASKVEGGWILTFSLIVDECELYAIAGNGESHSPHVFSTLDNIAHALLSVGIPEFSVSLGLAGEGQNTEK